MDQSCLSEARIELNMKLTVKNIARISSAEIELGGITVISGSNGTGKSTISRSLMTLSSVSANIAELVQTERINSVFHALRKSFMKHGADLIFPPRFLTDRKNDWAKWLSKDWWLSFDRPAKWIEEDNRLLVFPEDIRNRESLLAILKDTQKEIFSILERSDSEYVDFICRKSVSKSFKEQVRPVFADGETKSKISIENNEEEISFTFLNGELKAISGIGRSFNPSTLYVEPLNYVDFVNSPVDGVQDRYTARRFCICNAILHKPSDSGLSFEEADELNEAKKIISRIVKIIRGSLFDDNRGIRFSEGFADQKHHPIEVLNIASGMKTMAAIVRMVENRSIRRGSMLIIDEPETNLHPDWQVKFATFLVLLCRDLGVSLLMNTHSPYFLQAIWKFTKKASVPSKFYNMVQGDIPDSFKAEDVSTNINCVFKAMSEPFDNLIGE